MSPAKKLPQPVAVPKHLWQCETFAQQKAWCRQQFELGRTLTDPGIWLAGADPDAIIRALRRAGMPLQTCYVKTVDAADVEHPRTLAWRLKDSAASAE